jgi:5-methyltetrahydropteroyltriglutamate--homocysteine methyltransferase
LHICRGNNQGLWHAQGGYEAISSGLFPRLSNYEYFLLEYDDERSGTFEPLRDVPDGSCVVLGLVSTKRGAIEPADLLKARIREAARFHPLEQLAISPQCGFASTVFGNPVSETAQRAKLELVGRTGREVWG